MSTVLDDSLVNEPLPKRICDVSTWIALIVLIISGDGRSRRLKQDISYCLIEG
jgi:hypothetical protein